MLKGRNCEFALKGADAQAGALTDLYDGVRPQHNNYSPMKLQGNIILGTGGDNSEGAEGTFFEGAMTVRKRPAWMPFNLFYYIIIYYYLLYY